MPRLGQLIHMTMIMRHLTDNPRRIRLHRCVPRFLRRVGSVMRHSRHLVRWMCTRGSIRVFRVGRCIVAFVSVAAVEEESKSTDKRKAQGDTDSCADFDAEIG